MCQTTLAGDAAYAKAVALGAVQVECPAVPKRTALPAVTYERAHTCVRSRFDDGVCQYGLVCMPYPMDGDAKRCEQTLSGGCSPGFTDHVYLWSSIQDDRTCSDCECETMDSCANARLELHDPEDPNCSKAPQTTIPADGNCHPTGYTTSWLTYQAETLPSESCRVTRDSLPEGGVSRRSLDGLHDAARHYCCR